MHEARFPSTSILTWGATYKCFVGDRYFFFLVDFFLVDFFCAFF